MKKYYSASEDYKLKVIERFCGVLAYYLENNKDAPKTIEELSNQLYSILKIGFDIYFEGKLVRQYKKWLDKNEKFTITLIPDTTGIKAVEIKS